jgi:uncharacterized protein with PIN domain
MTQQISIRFYQLLNDFLPEEQREKGVICDYLQPRSVKDLIESIGVPHTEVDLIIVNGESVDFDYLVQADDDISVYPVATSMDEKLTIAPLIHCQPQPLNDCRFILDVHLGRLAAYLRMLGFDCLYRNDYEDQLLANISAEQQRILLTCDRQLLMRKQVSHGYFVRSREPQQQLIEILKYFDLYNKQKPFSRCMRCNGKIRPVEKQAITERLSDATKKYYDEFYICEDCENLYWKGSHYLKMIKLVKSLEHEE